MKGFNWVVNDGHQFPQPFADFFDVVALNGQDQAPGFNGFSIGRGRFGVEVAVEKLGKHLRQSACGPTGVDSAGALFVDHIRHQTV